MKKKIIAAFFIVLMANFVVYLASYDNLIERFNRSMARMGEEEYETLFGGNKYSMMQLTSLNLDRAWRDYLTDSDLMSLRYLTNLTDLSIAGQALPTLRR